jgi:hypothetical protein
VATPGHDFVHHFVGRLDIGFARFVEHPPRILYRGAVVAALGDHAFQSHFHAKFYTLPTTPVRNFVNMRTRTLAIPRRTSTLPT